MNRREQEILTALSESGKAITTAQITAWCISQVGAELPNNPSIVSKLIFNLRERGCLTSFQSKGVNVHQLTEIGKGLLSEVLTKESKIEATSVENKGNLTDGLSISESEIREDIYLDQEYAAIYKVIKEHAAFKSLCTVDKLAEKLAILNQLICSPFMDETVTHYLQEIADNLQTIVKVVDFDVSLVRG